MKPEDVLITREHVVKVMDLGVARLNDEALRLSQTGAFVGSVPYAARACFAEGGKHVDGRADLHALGLVLYELACGVSPYHAEAIPEILRKVLHEDSPRRQRRHAKELERLRRREADLRKAGGTGATPPGRTVEGDVLGPSSGVRPEKKLSEVLLDLAAPLLPGEERSLEEMRTAIHLAATVWNTVVLDPRGKREWERLVASIGKRAGEGARSSYGSPRPCATGSSIATRPIRERPGAGR